MTPENNDTLKGYRATEGKSGEEQTPLPLMHDDAPPPPPPPAQEPAAPPPTREQIAEPPPRKLPDDIRAKIAERFAKKRTELMNDYDGDESSPENLYGNLGKSPDSEPDQPEDKPEAEVAKPEKVTLSINGRARTMTIEQVAAHADMTLDEVRADLQRAKRYAQKELAASERLNEAKKLRETPSREEDDEAPRAERPAPHQERQEAEEEGDDQPGSARNTNGIDYRQLVETLQVDDPETAAKTFEQSLNRLIEDRTQKALSQAEINSRFQKDLEASASVVEEFRTAHPGVVENRSIAAALKARISDEYRGDLTKALVAEGLDEDEARAKVNEAPDDRVIITHRDLRVQRNPHVRPVSKELMEKVYQDVQAGFGGRPATTSTQNGLSRTEQKRSLQPQPRRASVPPATTLRAEAPQSRKAVVAEMARRTGKNR